MGGRWSLLVSSTKQNKPKDETKQNKTQRNKNKRGEKLNTKGLNKRQKKVKKRLEKIKKMLILFIEDEKKASSKYLYFNKKQ